MSQHVVPEDPRRHPVVAVQPAQLGEDREVLDRVEVGRGMPLRQEPQHVAPPEAPLRRVRVAVGVGVAVVVTVVLGPPQRALLGGGGATDGHEELGDPRHPVRAVGEVAVVAGRDEERPADVQHHEQHQRFRGDAGEEKEERDEVDQDKRGRGPPIDAFVGRSPGWALVTGKHAPPSAPAAVSTGREEPRACRAGATSAVQPIVRLRRAARTRTSPDRGGPGWWPQPGRRRRCWVADGRRDRLSGGCQVPLASVRRRRRSPPGGSRRGRRAPGCRRSPASRTRERRTCRRCCPPGRPRPPRTGRPGWPARPAHPAGG